VICSLLGFSIFFRSTKPPLSPPFHPHSFGERFSLGASWVFLMQ